MQKHSYYLCKYLAQKHIHIDLYHSSKNGEIPDISNCFTLEELNYIHGHYIPYPSSDRWPGRYLRTSVKYSAVLYKALSATSMPDLIYAKGLCGWALLKQKKQKAALPPVCINVHGYEYYQEAGSVKGRLQQIMLRPAFRFVNEQADYIFSYGAKISDIIRQHIADSEDKIIEIPAGIEKDFLRDEPISVNKVREFVFLGRFERRKGIQELIKALQLLMHRYDFRFHFIGNIPEVYRLSAVNFIFHGELSNKDAIKKILTRSDILVCPSYAEGMPNVILEGMASGCAIIGTEVGAVPVEVSADNGWLVEPGSVRALYKAMEEAITIPDHELLQKKNFSLRKVKSDFLWEDIILKVIRSFEVIMTNTKQRVRQTIK